MGKVINLIAVYCVIDTFLHCLSCVTVILFETHMLYFKLVFLESPESAFSLGHAKLLFGYAIMYVGYRKGQAVQQ